MSGIRTINPYYRDLLRQVYDVFGAKEFTCTSLRKRMRWRDFQCQKLRTWHNDGILEYTTKKLRVGGKHMRVWRFTNSTMRYFMGLP